jgi:hypothetical protein
MTYTAKARTSFFFLRESEIQNFKNKVALESVYASGYVPKKNPGVLLLQK